MKRPILGALAAGALVLALLPASAMAADPANLDVDVEPGNGVYVFEVPITQSFVPTAPGALTDIEVACNGSQTYTLVLNVDPAISAPAAQCTSGWVDFVLAEPKVLDLNTTYNFTVSPPDPNVADGVAKVAGAAYADGEATQGGLPIDGVGDIAFRTYMAPQAAPTPTAATTLPPTTTSGATDGSSSPVSWPIAVLLLGIVVGIRVVSDRLAARK